MKLGIKSVRLITKMTTQLLPCPFCGEPHNLKIIKTVDTSLTAYTVDCSSCYSAGPVRITEYAAIEAWNKRKNYGHPNNKSR